MNFRSKLKSVTKGRFELGTDEEKKQAEEQIKQKEERYKSFLEACQKKLDEYVKTDTRVQSPGGFARMPGELRSMNIVRTWSACCRKAKAAAPSNAASWN